MKEINILNKKKGLSPYDLTTENIRDINIKIRYALQSIGRESSLEIIRKGEDEIAHRELEIHLEDINPLWVKISSYYNSLCREERNGDFKDKRAIQEELWKDTEPIRKRIVELRNVIVEGNRVKIAEMIYKDIRDNASLWGFKDNRFIPGMNF